MNNDQKVISEFTGINKNLGIFLVTQSLDFLMTQAGDFILARRAPSMNNDNK